MHHALGATAVVALGAAASAASLAYLPVPFAGFFLAWAAVLATLAARARRLRFVLLALAMAALAIGATELVLDLVPRRMHSVQVVDGDPNRPSHAPHPILGYEPMKSVTINFEQYFDDELIVSARYNLDERGLRSSNPADRPRNGPCLLFFVGSDVFGRGLDDVDTLPWQVGELTGLRTVNFSAVGWGPHQMLAAFDTGLLEGLLDCEVRGAFYLADDGHVARAAGKRFFDKNGPRYELQDDGDVVLAGHFNEGELAAWILKWRLRSRIQRRLFSKPAATQADFELFAAIVARTRAHVRRLGHGSDLHVLIWPNDWFEAMEERFGALGIPHYRIAEGLPGYTEDRDQYRLHEEDSHANRLANRLLARYIVREILGLPVDESRLEMNGAHDPRTRLGPGFD